MPAATKITLFFNQGRAGFSETFYSTNPDPAAVAASVPNAFYQSAANFRSTSTILQAVRYSRVDGGKSSFLVTPYPSAQGKRGETSEPGPDVASTTAVYRLLAQNGVTRRIFIRGLADIDTTRDIFGNDIQSPALDKGKDKYFLAAFNAGFQIRWIPIPPAAGAWILCPQVAFVYNATSKDGYSWLVTNDPAPLWAVGSHLVFNGVPSTLTNFPRKALVTALTGIAPLQAAQIKYNLPGGTSQFAKNMRAFTYTPAYSSITQWFFERFSEHKTGRPFGSLRGRKRAAVSGR